MVQGSGGADEEGFRVLAEQMRYVAAIGKSREECYRKLLHNVEAKEVFEKSGVTLWECRNCGHLVMGVKAPEICPVCKHPQSYFEVRAENYQYTLKCLPTLAGIFLQSQVYVTHLSESKT